MAASRRAQPTRRSSGSHPTGCSSLAANNPTPDEHNDGSPNTRTGAEGRISNLKRSYGLRRSRLKGKAGAHAWSAWAILAYNLDTLAIRAR
jgi:hypothetical protein